MPQALRMGLPLPGRIAGRVAAQREHVLHADGRVRPDDVPQLRHGVADSGQVTDRD